MLPNNDVAEQAASGFEPSAAGTVRDLREQTDLERAIAFFGSESEARSFARASLAHVLADLPQSVCYVDFGGGQGTLARVMEDALRAAGRRTHCTVIDSNARYLAAAKARGLQVRLANIETCAATDVDFATMRLVNHYCGYEQQARLLRSIHRALRPGAALVSQIETGEAVICRLQTRIANALSTEGRPGYCWPTLEEYLLLTSRAGFDAIRIIGESPPVNTSVDEALASAWRRFHGRRLEQLVNSGGADQAGRLLAERARFFRESRLMIAAELADAQGGSAQQPAEQLRFRLQYPIVYCRREA